MLCTTCAQAAGPWSKTACCAVSGNECRDSGTCVDKHAASDFLFRLQPGEPQRFLPTGTGDYTSRYQSVGPDYWPIWGYGDLSMGDAGPPGGTYGYCDQGNTYERGVRPTRYDPSLGENTYVGLPTNEACGGFHNWGRTDLEVWHLASLSHFPGSRIVTNASWGASVNGWANKPAEQVWALCYSSFTDNRDTPATFHKQCDQYSTTMVFAINALNFTFGAFVRCFLYLFSLIFLAVVCLLFLL